MSIFEEAKLGDFIEVNPSNIGKDYTYTHIEYLDISNVGTGTIKKTSQYEISEAPSRAKRLVKDGDTIVATVRPNLRSYAYISAPVDNMVVSTGFAVLRPSKKISGQFLYYTITNPSFTDYLVSNAKGATYPAVDAQTFERAKILLPAKKIQSKIAKILSNYDDLIDINTKKIKVLEEIVQNIYNEWFINFNFPGNESVPMVDNELGKIPEGWSNSSLLEIDHFDFLNKGVKQYEGEKIYYATGDVEGIEYVKPGTTYKFEDKPSRAQRLPELYSVWFARMKDAYKVLLFSDSNSENIDKTILSSGFVGFKTSRHLLPFLYQLIKSTDFNLKKDQYSTGATQVSLTDEGLSKMKFIIPSEEVMKQYGELTSAMIEEIILLQAQNHNLIKQRDLLLPKLISGEINVENLDIDISEKSYNNEEEVSKNDH